MSPRAHFELGHVRVVPDLRSAGGIKLPPPPPPPPPGGGHGPPSGGGGQGKGQGPSHTPGVPQGKAIGRGGAAATALQPGLLLQAFGAISVASAPGPVAPPVGVRAPTYVTSVQSSDSGPGSSTTVTIPAGLATGQLLLVALNYENSFGSVDNDATIAGFTSLAKKTSTDEYIQLFGRTLDGSEPYIGVGGTVTANYTGGNNTHIFCGPYAIAYSGVDTVTNFDSFVKPSGTNTSFSQAYTTAKDNDLVLDFLFVRQSAAGSITFTSPAGGTDRTNRAAFGAIKIGMNESVAVHPAGGVTCAANWTSNVVYMAILVGLRGR